MTTPSSQREVRVDLGARSYSVVVQPGLIREAGSLVAALDAHSRSIIVTNAKVAALYLDPLMKSLKAAGLTESVVVELPDGEKFKTLSTVETIYDAILDLGADRSMIVIALGGGVVGDMAGLAAATVLRGVRLVMVPTTLLAQVDSSVGGKTGVNRRQGKNLVGAFHQPSLVISDTETLSSLSEREFRAGLAEVIKYGVVLSKSLFTLLEERSDDVIGRDPDLMADIVARCCEVKAEVVAQDELESGLRRVLNFGHTVGHAIEKVTGYERYLHGEAVAIGMLAAARVSAERRVCDAALPERLARLLDRLGLASELPADIPRDALGEAIGFDKKRSGGKIEFVLVSELGGHERSMLSVADVVASL